LSRVETDSNDLIVLFPTTLESVVAPYFLDFLANFFNNGFVCCCSSVNAGFCESTFF
jgi:hypothetical protein